MSTPSWEREPVESDGTLVENWLFRLRKERFRSRLTGKGHDFFVLHLADSVNVVALTEDRELVLVRQFRAGSNSDGLETPGGLLEPGENPVEAGARELLEETGYFGKPAQLLGQLWSNPSIMTCKSATVLITDAQKVADPNFDEGEEVVVELVRAKDVLELIRSGEIAHALTVAGLFWWLISEQTDTPLAKATRKWPRFQFRINSMLTIIAVSALVCGTLTQTQSWRAVVTTLNLLSAGILFVLIRLLLRLSRLSHPTHSLSASHELKRTRKLILAIALLFFAFMNISIWVAFLLFHSR